MILFERESFGRDVRWGLAWGLWLAVAFSVLAAVLAGVQGGVRFSPLSIISVYLLSGIVGGGLVGVFRPTLAKRWVATILGSVIGVFVYSIGGVAAYGFKDLFSPSGVISTLILGILMGGTLGYSWSGKKRKL